MVDVALIKKLRSITHAPLKDCKSALEASDGDLDRAQEILREKGALKAASKADRETNEGVVVVKQEGGRTYGLQLGCETDFVAKNPTFIALAESVADVFNESSDDFEGINALSSDLKEKAENILKDNFVTIGENMKIVDAFALSGDAYVYRHPGNKVAAIVFFEGDEAKAKDAALQVAAMNPQYLSVEDVPSETKEKLTAEFEEEMKDSGKPADIVEKIISGKLQKEWRDIVLLEQVSIVDDSKSVKANLGETSISKYVRFAI